MDGGELRDRRWPPGRYGSREDNYIMCVDSFKIRRSSAKSTITITMTIMTMRSAVAARGISRCEVVAFIIADIVSCHQQ